MPATPARHVGHGPRTVFWLHGWFGSATAWGEVPRSLDPEAATHVFLDYRGHGQRRDEPGEYTLAEIAGDVLAEADRRDAPRFSLVGHSMGGGAALRVVADAPERVEALIGISPTGPTPTPFDERARGLFYGAPADHGSRAAIIDLTTGTRLTQTWVQSVVSHSATTREEAFGSHLRAWAEADFAEELREAVQRVAGLPAMVVVGGHDPALGEETIRATWGEFWPDLRIEVLPDAGHYGPDEAPVRVATLVDAFLEQTRERAQAGSSGT
ncbi:alpha/beta fold hydrolase [Mobilicoccus caccae]|uniref:Esterase n=1 Tax=Mobilicoccus caccae TaxID=1859295 RepID=A0ABQ6IP96_9MICO|nr:alpha/beta hydrolase [Mobilicoccus caccae]GMA39743.1 esterase [Mobilicoccus caccae]